MCEWATFGLRLLTLFSSKRDTLRVKLYKRIDRLLLKTWLEFGSASILWFMRSRQVCQTSHCVTCKACPVPVFASFLLLHALECCTGTATRVTTSLFNTLISLPQFSICCSLHLQHAGKTCPNCLIMWQSTLVKPLWEGFEKERRLFLINFCWDSLMDYWTSQAEHVS